MTESAGTERAAGGDAPRGWLAADAPRSPVGPAVAGRAAGGTVGLAAVHDPARLEALRATDLLAAARDPEARAAFDRLARIAARALGVPAALVSLVDADRQVFLGCVGLSGEPGAARETPLSHSVCQHVVADPRPLLIEDARRDPRLAPGIPGALAVRDLGVTAYAGVPLATPDGHVLGAFCAVAAVPRRWTDDDVAVLTDLAAAATAEIALRAAAAAARAARAEAEAARAAAIAANQSKAAFLANMSHELRTPLNAIGGYAQLLDMGLHGPVSDAQRAALGRVQRAQTHLLGLINDVLNYAKLEAGRVEYDVRAVDVRDAVADVLPLVAPQIAAKGLALDVRLPETPCLVWADGEKLGQVLVNLLSNATKFTTPRPDAVGDARGRITVELATRRAGAPGPGGDAPAPAESVFLRVADTGRGVPRAKHEAIFEPFVQVRTGYAQATEGTGLGLAISRDLARGMGGDLRVRSREGEGARFTVTLRRAVDAAGRPTDRRVGDERRDGDERRAGEGRRGDDGA
jgi:signal transduction histidine kinase